MKKILLSLLLLVGFSGVIFAQSDLQVIAVVKYGTSESITLSELKTRCNMYEKQRGNSLSVQEREMVLKALIEEKLVIQAATKAGISIPDTYVDQYFLQNMAQAVGAPVTEKQLNDILIQQQGKTLDQALQEQVGMNVVQYKNFLKNQLISQQYILMQKKDKLASITASDEEIRDFYENNKKSFVWSDMLKVFLVIVPKGDKPDAAKNTCADLLKKYKGGSLTEEKIVEQGTKDGYQAGSLVLPKTEEGAAVIRMPYKNLCFLFDSGEGYLSEVQETADDYRFIKVSKKYNAKLLAISDIVQPETTVTVYEYIKANLQNQKQMTYLTVAAQEVADDLNKPEYVENKKTGDALKALLSW